MPVKFTTFLGECGMGYFEDKLSPPLLLIPVDPGSVFVIIWSNRLQEEFRIT